MNMDRNAEINRLLAEIDKVLDPTKGMTGLERYIHEQVTIEAEMYAGIEDELCEDPFDRLAREEEELIAYFGHNLNHK